MTSNKATAPTSETTDVCNELATNFSSHNAIKICRISETIAFSSVWKVSGLLLVLPDIREVFFSTKADKNLFAYNQGLREGIHHIRYTSYTGGWKYTS